MTNKNAWSRRAARHGESITGVLFEGLPDHMNQLIHEWHMEVLRKFVLPHLPGGGLILDLGCGYGRVAEAIRQYRPDVRVVGLDYIRDYCDYFAASSAGSAVCGDIEKLPFQAAQFDCVLAITSLMYVDAGVVGDVISGIYDLLKKDGIVLFMDPSREFIDFTRAIRRSGAPSGGSTGGAGFYKSEYRSLVLKSGWRLQAAGGNMGFAIMSPLLLLTWPVPVQSMFGGVSKMLDRLLSRMDWYAVHRWILVRRL